MGFSANKVLAMSLVGAFSVCAWAASAEAALGEPESSVDRDASTLRAPRTSVPGRPAAGSGAASKASGAAQAPRVHELKNGRHEIRQFADANGRIYAVAWSGAGHPDLSVVLGSFYAEYEQARAQRGANTGSRSSRYETANLVITLSAAPRSSIGLVYIPAYLPPDVKPEDLK